MGMNEDDRIRSKNRTQTEAFELYQSLIAMGYDNAYIIKYAHFAKQQCTDSFRNDMYSTMISIVRSIDEADKRNPKP